MVRVTFSHHSIHELDRIIMFTRFMRQCWNGSYNDTMLMRQCVSLKECVCKHDRLAEGIDHRSELLLSRHWIHTMTCYRSIDFIRWHTLAWGQHNDGVVLNNKSAKLLYISNKNNQNYRKQINLTTILTNNEAKNDTSKHNLSTVSMSHYLSSRIIHSYDKLNFTIWCNANCWNAVRIA